MASPGRAGLGADAAEPGPRRRPASGGKSARTRQRILDATATVLAERGYAGTRLSDVAALAELRAPAVYYYFDSREQLVEEVVTTGMVRNLDHVRTALAGMPAEASGLERIARAVEAHLQAVLRLSDYTRAAIRSSSQLPPAMRERHLRAQQRYVDVWRDLLGAARESGEIASDLDVGAARMLLLGALNWSTEWWNPRQGSLRAIVRTAQHVICAGLAGPGAGGPSADLPALLPPVPAEPADPGTRERILDAAAVVLNRRGYAGTRLADIGAVAGLQAPAIYYYFGSRDDVIEEVVQVGLRRTMAHVTGSLDALGAGAPPAARIATAVRAHLEIVVRDSGYAAAAIRNAGQLPPDIRRVQLLDQHRYAAVWRALLESASAAGVLADGIDTRAARMLVIGALNGAPDWWRAGRGSLSDTVETAQRLVCRGLLSGSATRSAAP
ncbi:TetR/AcrR family transcriptional regulator [Pseudonocardia sp. WMMC193]|uniref:TetR/AcrR family transcriptional regulator n=1 Tax=Pseudonocardia sp. WMMC193 TaxID=2911965 RepID=UPI001F01023B|nr:TetR family transcriptional regulator [Pseudonocardia sp. WMMC193]MCF7548582.1 TetR family transcriptional regulator [Pseudonocardia sp. WMMC193]